MANPTFIQVRSFIDRGSGIRKWYAECSRHRRPKRLTGYGPSGGLGTHNGVRMQAAEHAREHLRDDAKREARKAVSA